MDGNRLSYLLKKQHLGKCTNAELKELEVWYAELEYQNKADVMNPEGFEEKMLKEFHEKRLNLKSTKSAVGNQKYLSFKYAIRIAAMLALAFIIYEASQIFTTGQKLKGNVSIVKRLNQNRFITLADGTIVVLKANSKLDYVNNFSGQTREVSLTGEAYFDVKHNPKKPFIIHTGNITTKVLGTSFNIKALPNQKDIIVTVTRGKVQVADLTKVLAVLTPNKQISYNSTNTSVIKEEVKAEEKILWVKQDMAFDSETFGNIAEQLSRRYGVKISFTNPSLKNCPITATFEGSEPLAEVLDILCMTRKSHYEIKNNEIFINGQGCED